MKLFIFLFIMTINASAQMIVNLSFTQNEAFQGEIVSAKAKISFENGEVISPGILKGQTISDIIFIHELSTPIKQEGESAFIADTQVVFVNVPKDSRISGKVNNMDVTFNLNGVSVTPVEIPENFILSQFDIPKRKKIITWFFVGLILFLIVCVGRVFYSRSKRRKAAKLGKEKFKKLISEASAYEDVVLVWNKKLEILQEFPSLLEDFKELETILFKIQFKPSQSETERQQVCDAYKRFKSTASGRLNGV